MYPNAITEGIVYDNNTVLVYINDTWSSTDIANALYKVFSPLTFTLPDARGVFLRGVNGARSAGIYADPDASTRADRGDGTGGNNVGTMQFNEYKAHAHNLSASVSADGASGYYLSSSGIRSVAMTAVYATNSGGAETRPNNMYCYWIIKT
jgi:hypothetical protein